MDDRTSLNATITTLGPKYRSSAVKSCYNPARGGGQLLGHQIAISNFDNINGTLKNSDLIWLKGIGNVV